MGGAFSSWILVGEDVVGKKVRTPKEAIRVVMVYVKFFFYVGEPRHQFSPRLSCRLGATRMYAKRVPLQQSPLPVLVKGAH